MRIIDQDFGSYLSRDYLQRETKGLHIPEFVLEVLRPLEKEYYADDHFIVHPHYIQSPLWEFEERFQHTSIAILVHTVPIFLRYHHDPNVEPDENSIIELLGAYYSGRNGGSPHVELYLQTIYQSAKGKGVHFKWLCTIVLLHELAHAALDIRNIGDLIENVSMTPYSSEFGRWREESMANAITLRIIESYGDSDFFDFAKSFMLSQPPEYALGVLMKDFDTEYFDSIIMGKTCGVNPTLKDEWLQYAKGTPNWDGLRKWSEWLRHSSTYELDGVRYWKPWDFVADIVKKVLNDYEREHGDRMTAQEFQSLFPRFLSRPQAIYMPVNEDKDTPKKTIVNLKDADYSLHSPFQQEDVRCFLAKVPVPWTEFRNFGV